MFRVAGKCVEDRCIPKLLVREKENQLEELHHYVVGWLRSRRFQGEKM